ncbi:hypothetical protein NIES37_09130 [Tolypothrix tenuis PCC 7101]|uniref:Uncharacterized protein n=1 Tax=Tolypothrix tenuis PCC 7101 TaxID=231146 RepID=A0A1Z4MU20_9CYAN|nr:hypothetical protein [Aulosira sp. FACHB-113]BAY96976.1 hypothetical protein NIES37_09130 [Tolypothrix tenuis PCC 7101]BAZ72516.1 hypothetical protein NIES50_10700 [Aulosira laxa NIES-50]
MTGAAALVKQYIEQREQGIAGTGISPDSIIKNGFNSGVGDSYEAN